MSERGQLLARMVSDLESDRSERTQSLNDMNKFCEAVCAFANDLPNSRQPGFLFIGVDDAGRPSGANISDELLRNLGGIRSEGNILPQPVLTVEKFRHGGHDLAVVEVQPSDRPPVRFRGRVYVRVGPRRGIATAEEERRLSERAVDQTKT